MISRFCLCFAILVLGTTASSAQDGPQRTAQQIFAEVRDLMNTGSYEVAADTLKQFLARSPTSQDYLTLEEKYNDPTLFLKLNNVARWYDTETLEKEFRTKVLAEVIKGSIKANKDLAENPTRIDKFVRNLGGPPEEYGYALKALSLGGAAVVLPMVGELRRNADADSRAGILRAVTELGPNTVPGFLAAAEGMADEYRLMLLGAIVRRPDLINLTTATDTNPVPYLWYLASLPGNEPNPLRTLAVEKLRGLYPTAAERRSAEDELTRAALPLYNRKGVFRSKVGDSKDATIPPKPLVQVWKNDGKGNLLPPENLSPAVAEEQFGLKYLKWALERNAGYEPAQDLFLSLATDRAIERIQFKNLAVYDDGAFRLLAAAPAETLIRLLERSYVEKRTPLVLGLVQALGDRAEPLAGNVELTPAGGDRPPVLVKGLDYPDPRVQLAAALALLKIPNSRHGAHARIVDVLKRSISPDAGTGTNSGKAIVADSSTSRGDQVANLLKAIGYQVEVVGTGRQLAQRIDRAADFDIVLIDRHIVSPLLPDLIPQLRADPNTARRPMLIVASPDERTPLGLEAMLARLASLIAATETTDFDIPAIPIPDRRRTQEELDRARKTVVDLRDIRLRMFYDVRLARLERLLEAANVKQSEMLKRRLDLRLPQLTMAALIAEYDLTPTSAPKMVREFQQLTDLLRRQTDLDPAVQNVDTTALVKLVRQLESVLTADLQKKFDAVRIRLDEESLALAPEIVLDRATEAALHRLAQAYPGVSVIREPWSKVGFEQDVEAAMTDPAQRPRADQEKADSAQAAVHALLQLATGAITGYDIIPATDALRAALARDALVPAAAEALARLPLPNAQTDLVRLAADGARTPAIRRKAAQEAVRSVQAFGRILPAESIGLAAKAEAKDPALSSDLAVLNALLSGTPASFVEALKGYTIKPPEKLATAPAPKKEEPKATEEPKN